MHLRGWDEISKVPALFPIINLFKFYSLFYYIGSAEGHEYPDLQVGDEVNPRPFFVLS
jgi:hypothetical protein